MRSMKHQTAKRTELGDDVDEMLQGAWWTPDVPDLRVPGTLARFEDSWRLNLIGTLLVDAGGGEGLHLAPPHTIWGSCHETSYTLLECYLEDIHGPDGFDTAGGNPDQWSMTWRVGRLVRGGEVTTTTRFSWASFQMTGLAAWWPPSGLRGWPGQGSTYRAPENMEIPVTNGKVTIGVGHRSLSGPRERSLREHVAVLAERDPGFTLDELEQEIVAPLRALVAIGVDEPVTVFNFQAFPGTAPAAGTERLLSLAVDPHDGEEPHEIRATRPVPLAPSLASMPTFIPSWLTVARHFFVPLDAVEPRQRSGSLQLQLLDVVNAAETLHRMLHTEPYEHPLADRVVEVLKDSGQFQSAERRTIRDAVRVFVDITLEKRLLSLANELGPEVCDWLFGSTAAPWAFVTARIRNVLSHGFRTADQIHEDPGALAGALRLTEAVITLRLLIEAGLPSGSTLTAQLSRHHGMSSLAGQRIANWSVLAHRINPQQWPPPEAIQVKEAPEASS